MYIYITLHRQCVSNTMFILEEPQDMMCFFRKISDRAMYLHSVERGTFARATYPQHSHVVGTSYVVSFLGKAEADFEEHFAIFCFNIAN